MDVAELAARREPLPGPCVLVIGAVAARATLARAVRRAVSRVRRRSADAAVQSA